MRRERRSKYGAIRTTIDGITFDSKAEARAYADLRLLEKAGKIRNLELQPRYPIVINGAKVCDYVADFKFEERFIAGNDFGRIGWRFVTLDVKGVKTPVYRLKKKLVHAVHGVEIREL